MIGPDQVVCLSHDDYYLNQDEMTMEERLAVNYDHPSALETSLLVKHLTALQAGQSIERPVYSFVENTRLPEVLVVQPAPVIIVEGILLFESKPLRELLDLKIFVDTDADIRLARRIKRDVKERNRTPDFVIDQYLMFSRPMHLEFVEPNKRYADVIIPEGGRNTVALNLVRAQIREIVRTISRRNSRSKAKARKS
jgi:uridine kinase